MSARPGHPMVLPTDRTERRDHVGPWARQLNIDEMREDLSETIAQIGDKIMPVLAGLGIAVVAGGILVAAKLLTSKERR